jgi:hypothetical protein
MDYLNSNMLSLCIGAFRQILINDAIALHQGCSFQSVVEVYYGGQGQLGSENADSSNYLDVLQLYNAATKECFSDLSDESCESHTHLSLCTLRSICKLGTHELILVICWIIDVIIIFIVIIFVIPTSCIGALRSVNSCPLPCMGLSSLGCRSWHLYIFGSHATQLASHPSTGCQHLLQLCSCQMTSAYISF